MTEIDWYSASLLFYSVSDSNGKWDTEEVVCLVRASSFEEAFQKFLDLGHRREEIDIDETDGHRSAVRFAKIVSLNILPTQELDGAVICAVILPDDGSVVTVDSPLYPENSQPEYSM